MKEINAEENSIIAKQQEEKRLRDEALKRAQQQPYIIIRDPPKIFSCLSLQGTVQRVNCALQTSTLSFPWVDH